MPSTSSATARRSAAIDAVLGCGDLEPDYLCFLADAFHVPLMYIQGNHDRGVNWTERDQVLPGSIGRRIRDASAA